MVDRIIGHMIELHIQASFPLWREGNVIPKSGGGPALIRWLKAPTLSPHGMSFCPALIWGHLASKSYVGAHHDDSLA